MRRVLGTILLLAVCACGAGPTGVLEVAELQGPVHVVADTGSAAMARGGGGVSLRVTVENRGTGVVWIARCGDAPLLEVQRWEGSGWAGLHAAFCQTHMDMSPVRLEPGASHTGWGTVMAESGRFRFRVRYGPRPDAVDRVASSAAFELR
jgi:hypothetical protein